MSQSSEPQEALPPVLVASVHDVRYFASLLRGVNFSNRATVTVTERGLTITVEDARTLLGTAFIFAGVFDEYIYNPEAPQPRSPAPQAPRPKRKQRPQRPQNPDYSETESETESEDENDAYNPDEDEDRQASDNAAFEIPLNTLIECLNIFGTAGPSTGNISTSINPIGAGRGQGGGVGRGRGWQRAANEDEDGDGGRRLARGIEAHFGGGAKEGKTGMRLAYAGGGYPLTLIIAEDASGPTTTCEITTFDPEPHLELDFDAEKIVLKIILKSSWLRDALSELDPSCEKLTFIGNPPTPQDGSGSGRNKRRQSDRLGVAKPMLRIQASGTFGSTEMDYPNDREVLETFECQQTVSFSYRFGHILRTIRALQSSTKTSLRIDNEGLLSLQFLMPSPKLRAENGADAFIEFRCLALDDDV
ncbi:Rad1-domain-containing protein [Pholiota conissans]|uniref:Rad1-domain-containing protein n=1 Tax=Pholiota conissans TaxID=109636 RepID=A0A9P5ZFG9_9AGAR|nr:Rad1-domain-containing protein [Pholiota conissans]